MVLLPVVEVKVLPPDVIVVKRALVEMAVELPPAPPEPPAPPAPPAPEAPDPAPEVKRVVLPTVEVMVLPPDVMVETRALVV